MTMTTRDTSNLSLDHIAANLEDHSMLVARIATVTSLLCIWAREIRQADGLQIKPHFDEVLPLIFIFSTFK